MSEETFGNWIKIMNKTLNYYKENAKIIKQGLEEAGYTVYGGTNSPYVWLKLPDGMKSWDFFDKLLSEANVVGTPGVGFGPSGEGYFRLTGFGTKENTKEAIERIKNMKLVSDLIANEKYHYVELNHKEYIQDKLWQIGSDIHEHNLVSLRYARANAPGESIKRVVEPIAILFSEYYFYLNAYIVEKDGSGKYVHKYNYPAIFRIDRIKNYKHLSEKFKVSYANRFEEGEFRKRIQFMYAGKLQKVVLKFYGENPEPILDRLPTARIIEQYSDEYTIEAEVYGKGVIMWLLSQGSKVEVLRPESMREEMKHVLHDMLKLYE